MGLGLRAFVVDMKIGDGLKLYSDTAVAIGIAIRRGLREVRHIKVHQLWVQDRSGRGDIKIENVRGILNPADAVNKYVGGPELRSHCDWASFVLLSVRNLDML